MAPKGGGQLVMVRGLDGGCSMALKGKFKVGKEYNQLKNEKTGDLPLRAIIIIFACSRKVTQNVKFV